MENELAELERLIGRLIEHHDRLADLVDRQRAAMRRSDGTALADLGGRIEALVGRIAQLESDRRRVCRKLGPRLGWSADQAARARLAAISDRVGGAWGRRLRAGSVRWMSGRPKASVLPEPVLALPQTSRPARASGMVSSWMGKGVLIPAVSSAATSSSQRPRSRKDAEGCSGRAGDAGRGLLRERVK